MITEINTSYTVTQFYATAGHPDAIGNYFLAGAQDNGTQKFTLPGLAATVDASGGDGAYCNIDEADPTYQFTQYVYNNYYRSNNGGRVSTMPLPCRQPFRIRAGLSTLQILTRIHKHCMRPLIRASIYAGQQPPPVLLSNR